MIGRMQITADKPRPHLAALIEEMEAHRVSKPGTPSGPSAIRRTLVSRARDERLEPGATPLIVTITVFVIVLVGALYLNWMF